VLIMCFALVLASTARAQGTSGVNNAELMGDYAFTFNGMTTGVAVLQLPSLPWEDSLRTAPAI
jgi:hypothetical protein